MTIDQAQAAYIRGDIDVVQLERRVSVVLDGTEAKRQQVRAERYCAARGHVWLQCEEVFDPFACGRCGKPWAEETDAAPGA